jgi:hypothetical protein
MTVALVTLFLAIMAIIGAALTDKAPRWSATILLTTGVFVLATGVFGFFVSNVVWTIPGILLMVGGASITVGGVLQTLSNRREKVPNTA